MRINERASQIWPILAYAALHRQTITYDSLGKLIGVPRAGLGQLLGPIQRYCLDNKLPALTSIVVSEISGDPSHGFSAADNVQVAQSAVYRHDWLSTVPPTPDRFAS